MIQNPLKNLRTDSDAGYNRPGRTQTSYPAFTLVEMITALAIISLLTGIVMLNLLPKLGANRFDDRADNLRQLFVMASKAAIENGKRYEIILDFDEGMYLLREITTSDLAEVLDEEIIDSRYFDDFCQLYYVQFDDGESTDTGQAKFRFNRYGFLYGGKVVLLDRDGNPHSLVINRLNKTFNVYPGDCELLLPVNKDDLHF